MSSLIKILLLLEILVSIFLFSSCAKKANEGLPNSNNNLFNKPTPKLRLVNTMATPSFINKGNLFSETAMEATPLIWQGKLIYMTSHRFGSEGSSIEIWDADSQIKISSKATSIGLGSAIVVNNELYVFGANSWSISGNSIFYTKTSDLVHWTTEREVFKERPSSKVFNTSISAGPNGYILAYEVCEDYKVCFNVKFLESSDLQNWTSIGSTFEVGYYTACPTIRYANGYYYVFFLSYFEFLFPSFATLVARSTDLVSWETSPKPVLWFDQGDDAGNASDLDLVEYNGNVEIVYSNLPQSTNFSPVGKGIRRAQATGTLSDFVKMFF